MDTKYIIFEYSEVDKIDFNQVLDTSIDTLRKNEDGSKTIVKWIGDQPQCVSELLTKSQVYTYNEIKPIIDGPEWSFSNIFDGLIID